MKSTYFELGDVLQIRIGEKPVAREVSQNQDVHISYAEDGTVVEVVLLNAAAQGWWPLRVKLPALKKSRAPRLRRIVAQLFSLLQDCICERGRRGTNSGAID